MSQHGDVMTLVCAWKHAMREVTKAKVSLMQADGHLESQSVQLEVVKARIGANQHTVGKLRTRTAKNRRFYQDLQICSLQKELVEQRQVVLRDFKTARRKYRNCLKSLSEKQQDLELCISQLGLLAGVDERYLDSLKIVLRFDVIDFYFGGLNRPDGEEHGHYVMALSDGSVVYRRDPGAPRGVHNYVDREMAC
jgi:hypothetical protein